MRFRITRHSGHAVPQDAMVLLLRRLGAQQEGAAFAMVGREIRATLDERAGDSSTREVRAEIGRRRVLDLVVDACGSAPELEADWFAISPLD